MWLVAGDRTHASELARRVIALLNRDGDDSYYAVATEAEAQLLIGNTAEAADLLQRAAQLHEGDFGALATTRRQLRLICQTLGLETELLSPLAGPGVAFFCGHIIAPLGQPGRFPARDEAVVAAAIAQILDADAPGYAYGALAGGADILWAEALLARGRELHVVLPFAREEFAERSVASCGPGWVERFDRCLAKATEVRYATADAYLGDDVLFRYGSEFAMGLALLRARYLDAEVRQLAVWDGRPAAGAAGTAIDVATWRRQGRHSTVVSPSGAITPDPDAQALPETARSDASTTRGGREVRAMLFGDVKGFSKLTDEQLPTFTREVLGAFAMVVERHEESVLHRNTWGDAIYVVLTDAATAASCALDLQEAIAAIDLEAAGLPAHLALRLGGHLGPVFPTHDPVLKELAFMGSHVSRTARIEPVTPPGEVYVTDAFAADLVLSGNREATCDYVGHMDAAKGYGKLRMYRLHRATGANIPAP